MNLGGFDVLPSSETFGQNASFKLEQPVGSMSISPSGRDVVLASKEGLHIIDLDSPYSPPRHILHRTPWEVADVQWSPFAIRDYWIVSTSNQKALVWNVGAHGSKDSIEYVLHGHSRAITDINFSAHHPDVLATCAVDSFVHGWDLRIPTRPAFSFSDWFSGATQVKWSRQDEHVIASSHDRFLQIWDKRKGAYPARTIEAHGTKIYGLDWNRFESTKIVTCSLDKTIKFWDTSNSDDTPERIIETGFPVWRARHTPFGWGLLAMPQRGNADLHLYDRRPIDGTYPSGEVKTVTTFSGHKGQVKEFLWRPRGNIHDGIDHRDFQLVSWGTDRELRLHSVSEETFNDIGYEKGVSKYQRLNFTRRGARYRTFRDVADEPSSPHGVGSRTGSLPSNSYGPLHRSRPSTNIGMSKVAVAQFRGWLHAAKKEKRTGMHGRGTLRQDTNPIAWMKNVKIASWDADTLADEITQAGEKFQKVDFEIVDIAQRKAVVSLQGPWEDNGSMVYIRADFRFPRQYPRDANAQVTLQRTGSMNSETYELLCTEVQTLAETFGSRQRGCIEAIIRYLLREQSMEQIVSWLLGEGLAGSKTMIPDNVGEALSSDSDDDDNLNGIADPSNSSANIRMPLAKGCGGLWAPNGSLVCFFPHQSKEPVSVLKGLRELDSDESPSNKLFEGFGRLQTNSPARKIGPETQTNSDDTASDTSESGSAFSTSASSSSSSSEAPGDNGERYATYVDRLRLGSRFKWKLDERSNRSITVDGTRIGDQTEHAHRNVVSIHHDIRALIPAQKHFAESYKILGNAREVCDHNATIAERARRPEIASAWKLTGLIVDDKVRPFPAADDQNGTHDLIMQEINASAATLRLNESSFVTKSDTSHEDAQPSLNFIKWGHSPLGSTYLITALISYFERRADIQMLAMLTAVLLQAETSMKMYRKQQFHDNALQSVAEGHWRPARTAVFVTNPEGLRKTRLSLNISKSSTSSVNQYLIAPIAEWSHQRRPTWTEGGGLDPYASQSTSMALQSAVASPAKAVSTSTSPESRRPGSTFSASRALKDLAQTYQSSPPSNASSTNTVSVKKTSPTASFVTGGWSSSLWGKETLSRSSRASVNRGDITGEDLQNSRLRSSMSTVSMREVQNGGMHSSTATTKSSTNIRKHTRKPRKRTTRVTLHNQERFDIEGHPEQPLLDPSLALRYASYRNSYAELLGVWGLVHQMAEMRLVGRNIFEASLGSHDSIKDDVGGRAAASFDLVRCCVDCGNALAPIEKNGKAIGWHCTSITCLTLPAKVSKSQVCSICETVVHGLIVPCLRCGHLSCYECAQEWFGEPNQNTVQRGSDHSSTSGPESNTENNKISAFDDERTCPAGCGCPCRALDLINILQPVTVTIGEEESYSWNVGQIPLSRQESRASSHVHAHATYRSDTHAGLDTALGSLTALSSRSRAASSVNKNLADMAVMANTMGTGTGAVAGDEPKNSLDELVPWASMGERFTSLGRGIGGGLSRGLSNKSSDATIRRAA